MSEPKRWLEAGAPRDIAQLFRAAQSEQPGEASLARTLTALGAGLAAISVAGGAGATGTAASALGAAKAAAPITGSVLLKWAALGATFGTLAVSTAILTPVAWRRTHTPAPSVRPQSRTKPVPIHALPAVPEPAVTQPGSVASLAETPAASHGARSRLAAAPASVISRAAPIADPISSTPLADETLVEEVRSVDRARAALAARQASETLALLDDYERRFAVRRFAPEALYLRMEALVSLGRTEQARAVAELLLARYPKSPHDERARAVLSKNP